MKLQNVSQLKQRKTLLLSCWWHLLRSVILIMSKETKIYTLIVLLPSNSPLFQLGSSLSFNNINNRIFELTAVVPSFKSLSSLSWVWEERVSVSKESLISDSSLSQEAEWAP